ncbi:sensor histidine kinase [Dyadobacter diqingensis]|uniref:sensor histidine kinase n=1 Tax=Dyadobacter diqingensis TaxID=2938121 RepID=UPI0020C18BEC|nr:HAMP domain-containing sensor histidine kinase [Dyadobacter diqingensis]
MKLIVTALISILTITVFFSLYADYRLRNCVTDNVIPTKSVKSENFTKLRINYTVTTKQHWFRLLKNTKIESPKILRTGSPIQLRERFDQHSRGQKGDIAPVLTTRWLRYSWWNYLHTIAALCLLTCLITIVLVRALTEKYKSLERQVAARSIELNQTIHVLRQSEIALLKSNQTKDQVITMILHDIRSPISFIATISSYLADRQDLISAKSFNETLFQLKAGAKSLVNFTEFFLAWANTQRETFKIQKQYFKLDNLFTDVTHLYQELAKIKGNEMIILPAHLTCYTDYQIFACIIRNLLDNANKFTRNGIITLSAFANQDELVVTVSDTGQGLSSAQIDNFLDENKADIVKGTGSILILSMLKNIGGRLEIKTELDKGSSFSIIMKNALPAQSNLTIG